jgi:hypothetical protein
MDLPKSSPQIYSLKTTQVHEGPDAHWGESLPEHLNNRLSSADPSSPSLANFGDKSENP